MLLTLTDNLTCPRCGPSAGLILLMEHAEERRVVTGALGCPLCRTQYRIEARVADLRTPDAIADAGPDASARPGASERQGASAPTSASDTALRVAALMELGEEGGFVLVDGPGALSVATSMRAYVPDQEIVVAIDPDEAGRAAGVEASVLLDSGALPIASRTLRAAAHVGGAPSNERLVELVRVVRPTGRIVIVTADGDVAAAATGLERLGVDVRARDETTVVGVVFGRG